LFTGSLVKIEYTVIVHPFMRVTYPRSLMSLVHTTRVYIYWGIHNMMGNIQYVKREFTRDTMRQCT